MMRVLACLWITGSGVSSASEPGPDGVLRGIVFASEGDRPLAGVLVRAGGHEQTTNPDGAFLFALPAGEQVLEFRGQRHTVPVVAGEITEIVISLQPGDEPAILDIEAARSGSGQASRKAELGPLGKISGRVIHIEQQSGIEGARVFVRGYPVEGVTGKDGGFEFMLPVGKRDLTVIHPKFSTVNRQGVVVTKDGASSVQIEMAPVAIKLQDVTISAPRIEGAVVALLDERRESHAVSDIIGAEQMSKSGDSDAAAALKRVTGVTVVGGKYVYVRGLGERYSSTLLNGSTLPSPEPERRVVPLDMFPADLLESVVIQKTFSPDMPGEFGGGSVQLRTRVFPKAFAAKLSLSTGLRLGTTFEDGLHYHGGSTDWLGFDDGTRALPDEVEQASTDSPLMERDMFSERGYTAEELERFGEAMPNIWHTPRYTVPPNAGVSATLGDSFKLFDMPTGYLASVVFDNGWSSKEIEKRIYNLGAGDQLELFHQYRFNSTENTITLAGILATGIDLSEHHQLRLTALVDRITDKEARIYQGSNRDVGTDIRVSRLRWIERMLFATQLGGLHTLTGLGDLEIDWRYNLSQASRQEPDRREIRFDLEDTSGRWRLSDRPEGNQRLFSKLLDINHDMSLDTTLPFHQWGGLEASLKAGLMVVLKSREVDTRRYKFQHKGGVSGDTDVLSQPPEQIFTPGNINPGDFQFEEITRQTDNYLADQQVLAGYLMTDLPLGHGLRLVGGLRVERSDQHVKTFELFNPDNQPVVSDLITTDLLPAAALSWDLSETMLVRLGASRTLSRPDFRELSPATFNDVTGGRQVYGNPELKRAVINNLDLRWEWYLEAGESISLGAFYKRFEQPIETIVVVSAQHSVTYENAQGADNLGLELEFRKSFDFIDKSLQDFYLAGNATWVYSSIELPEEGIQTSSERPLQGQSPYVLNFQLGYDNVDLGTSIVVLYNVFGKRIAEVGALGAPDVFEQPFHQMDLVFRQDLGGGFGLGFKARNLLDPEVSFTQGDKTTEVFRRGRTLSLSLSKEF